MTIFGGTLPQWITSAGVLTLLAGLATAYIRGWPERRRAKNEAKVIDHTEAETIRAEYQTLNKQARDDIHALRGELAAVNAAQVKCDKALTDAQADTRLYKEDMGTLLFLIRLLVSEVKRLDANPHNIIIEQAEMTVDELARKRGVALDTVSTVVAKAEHTVEAAQETLAEAKAGDAG